MINMKMRKEKSMQIFNYLKEYQIINRCLFWIPLEKYNYDQVKRIEAELERNKEGIGVNLLHYVNPEYTLDGIVGYFAEKELKGFYLKNLK